MNNSENKSNQNTLFETTMELSNKELKEKCKKLNVNTHGAIEKKDYAELIVNAEISKQEETTHVECSVCYEKIGEKNNCITPCGHTFCKTCINSIRKCALCRVRINKTVRIYL